MKQFIYILTDSNRKNLHVGLTHDLSYTMKYCKEFQSLFFDSHKRVSRLVYFEEIVTVEKALKRLQEISKFTRSQKERMIRLINTNWNDLSISSDINLESLNNNYQKQAYAS